jgi:ArsR family transcriptional regulator
MDFEMDCSLRMAGVVRRSATRFGLQLVDFLRKHAGKVCVYELLPLFDAARPTLNHHVRKAA